LRREGKGRKCGKEEGEIKCPPSERKHRIKEECSGIRAWRSRFWSGSELQQDVEGYFGLFVSNRHGSRSQGAKSLLFALN